MFITKNVLPTLLVLSTLFFAFSFTQMAFAQPAPPLDPPGNAAPPLDPPGNAAPPDTSTSTNQDSSTQSTQGIKFNNPLPNITSIDGLLVTLLNVLIVLATPLIVIFIILAGFKYVTAQGDPGKIEEAKRALVYSIIGGVIIIAATAIVEIVANTIRAF